MSSILTNNGAMVALQTMKQINRNMSQVQGQISTGLKVGSAKDNAATWAISKVMESDVAGFKTIQDSLSLGSSTVNVARNASETTVKLLTEIKEKIVGAQEQNVDRAKIQTDISQLRDQINSVVGAAQFNGLNLVNGDEGPNPVNILSSLDRGPNGVSVGQIAVSRQAFTEGEFGATATSGIVANDGTDDITFETNDIVLETTMADVAALTTPQVYTASVNGRVFSVNIQYVEDAGSPGDVDATETMTATAAALQTEIQKAFADVSIAANATDDGFEFSTAVGTAFNIQAGNGEAGILNGLDALNVDTDDADVLRDALGSIESMIQGAIDASAAFGSAQKRIDIQKEFVGSLMDSMKSGIGSLVDADMEETSARLQALQVQQQLGIQALSIANQQPQNILSLFR